MLQLLTWCRFALRQLPPRTVVRETTVLSQVTELLTNVRSGRRRIAQLTGFLLCSAGCSASGDDGARDVRLRLTRHLDSLPGVQVVAAASDATAAVEAILNHSPTVVLLDAVMPHGGGLRVLDSIRGLRPRPTVIVFTAHSDPEYERAHVEGGADYYLVKSRDWKRLLDLLTALAQQLTNAGHAESP